MADHQVYYRSAQSEGDLQAAYDLREDVFLREKKRGRAIETDEHDVTAHHIVADLDGDIVGTLRLYTFCPEDRDVKIGRVAVRSDKRGLGIGRGLMEAAHVWAQAHEYRSCYLHAQIEVTGFYEKLGYVTEGEQFMEAGTPHILMRRTAVQNGQRDRTNMTRR